MRRDEQTQRIPTATAQDVTTRMPGPLDLTAPASRESDDVITASADGTEILSLDEIFGPAEPIEDTHVVEPAPVVAEPVASGPVTAAAEAPTWTAIPLPPPGEPALPATDEAAGEPRRRAYADLASRVQQDAVTAWTGARRRGGIWLRSGDNALIILTALVAVLLILVVAAL